MFKKHLNYEIKQILPIAGIISAIELLLRIISGQSIVSLFFVSGYLFIPAIIIILTVTQFKFMMDRRSTDLYYSLPITRFQLYLSKLLSGMIALTIINLVHILGLVLSSFGGTGFSLTQLFINLLMSLLSLGIYAYTSFIFTRAHSTIDGIIFILGHVLLIPAIVAIIMSIYAFDFLVNLTNSLSILFLGLFGSIQFLSQSNPTLFYYHQLFSDVEQTIVHLLVLFVIPLLGIISIYGVYKTEKCRRLEDVEDLSHSYFGYKVLIPLYAITLSSIISMIGAERMLYIFVGILIYIGYAIYYRTMRLPAKGWYMALAVFVVSIFWMYVM
ncbi:MAG: ABC transporter permease subunit [Acholeplasmataceae bacterium]